jgi:UDP-glucose 4-epimerase
LGDGHQRKSYLYIQDCIDAILVAIARPQGAVNILNLGTDEYVEVNESIAVIANELRLQPELRFGGGTRGWIGDSPFIFLECKRMRSLEWAPKASIRESVALTLRWLQDNQWVLSHRT